MQLLDFVSSLDASPLAVFGGNGEESTFAAVGKALLPLGAYIALAPILWLFFRSTWRELDVDAQEHQRKLLASGSQNYRPAVLFAITALVLTMQEYYGGREFYEEHIKALLREVEIRQIASPGGWGSHIDLHHYNELYSYVWWAFARVFGYVAVPMILWKIVFPKDSLLDMGLRARGIMKHAWIYILCLLVVVPLVLFVSRSPDFGSYYPFYKQCSRSWVDFLAWESMYFAQFFALEIFFRGFWLSGLRRSMGSGAIFAMCVPYCMIHYGKPYLEAAGAVVAGVALGSLAMRTKSIYSGFLVHISVAATMDLAALAHKGGLPKVLWLG